MEIITIISVAAATITVSSAGYYYFRKGKRFINGLEDRLTRIEDNFKLRQELITNKELSVMNSVNNRVMKVENETEVLLINYLDNDIVEVTTKDRLMKFKSNINNFTIIGD